MEKVKIGKHTVELYEGIKELPVSRFQVYQKLLLIDAGVGGDITALDKRLEKTRRHLMAGETKEAEQELENLRQCVYLIQSGVQPRHRAFAALVRSVDGEVFEDATDAAIERITELLKDASQGEIDGQMVSVKKKIEAELTLYFPTLFDNPEQKQYFDLLKARTMAVLEAIKNGVDNPEAAAEAQTTALLTFEKPKRYDGPDGVEVMNDRNFEDVCIALREQLHFEPKGATVFEYYSAYDFLQRRGKEAEKREKRAKNGR